MCRGTQEAYKVNEWIPSRWLGAHGETYILQPTTPNSWRCTRLQNSQSKDFTFTLDEETCLVWWGDSGKYYFDIEDFVRTCDTIKWYKSNATATSKPAFVWKVLPESAEPLQDPPKIFCPRFRSNEPSCAKKSSAEEAPLNIAAPALQLEALQSEAAAAVQLNLLQGAKATEPRIQVKSQRFNKIPAQPTREENKMFAQPTKGEPPKESYRQRLQQMGIATVQAIKSSNQVPYSMPMRREALLAENLLPRIGLKSMPFGFPPGLEPPPGLELPMKPRAPGPIECPHTYWHPGSTSPEVPPRGFY